MGRAVALFLKAESVLPNKRGQYDCLPRSLALFRFLRKAGIPAVFSLGVRQHPFAAHAWVSLWGDPLLDRADDLKNFAVLADVP